MTCAPRLLAALLLCLPTAPAGAARRQAGGNEEDPVTARARIHLHAGVSYFNAGQYAEAAREMEQAYRLRPVPELLYNLAHCQERIGALDKALASYRAYLQGRPQAPDRPQVEQQIAQLEQQLRARPEPPPAAAPLSEPPPAPLATPAPPEKVVFKEIVVYREPPPKAGRSARLAALAMLGVTAMGLATGIAFTATAVQISGDVQTERAEFETEYGFDPGQCASPMAREDAANGHADNFVRQTMAGGLPAVRERIYRQTVKVIGDFCDFYRINVEAARINQTAAAIGYSVAGLSAVGALGLFLYGQHLDRRQERELARKGQLLDLSMSLRPYGGPTGAGLVLLGRF